MMYTIHHSAMCQNTLVQNNNLTPLVDRAANIESVHPQANYHRIEMVPTLEVVEVRAQVQEPHYYRTGYLQSNFLLLGIRTGMDMVGYIYMQHRTNLYHNKSDWYLLYQDCYMSHLCHSNCNLLHISDNLHQ